MEIKGIASGGVLACVLDEGAVVVDKSAALLFEGTFQSMIAGRSDGRKGEGGVSAVVTAEPALWCVYGRASDEDGPCRFEALEIRMSRDEAAAVLELLRLFAREVTWMADGDWDMHLHFRDEYDQWGEDSADLVLGVGNLR